MKMRTFQAPREDREGGRGWRTAGEGVPSQKAADTLLYRKALAAPAGLAPSLAWAASRALKLRLYW